MVWNAVSYITEDGLSFHDFFFLDAGRDGNCFFAHAVSGRGAWGGSWEEACDGWLGWKGGKGRGFNGCSGSGARGGSTR